VYSQVPSESGTGLVDRIKIKALTSKDGVSGDVIAKDMDPALQSEKEECSPNEEKEKPKKELVLIFTGEINSRPVITVKGENIDSPTLDNFDSTNSEYRDLLTKSPDKIWGLANALRQQNGEGQLANFGMLLVLGASQMYDSNKVNDKSYNTSVNQMMADKIKGLNLSKDDQIKLIASMSEFLYTNYNDPRNVTSQSDNNPRYWTAQAFGVFQQSLDNGGVCDDISFLGCQLYGALNPGSDCLTMHSSGFGGSQHFVMLLGDKGTRNYTTIDGSFVEKTQGAQYITMDPASPLGADGGNNIRLNGIVNGKHKSFAVIKNEYGQWMQKVMQQPGSPGDSIVGDLDGILLQNLGTAFEKHKTTEEERIKSTFKTGVNHGVLSNGTQMIAVYALIDKTTVKKKVGIGIGYNYGMLDKTGINNGGTYFINSNTMNWNYREDYENDIHRLHINPYYGLGNTRTFTKGNTKFKLHYLNGVYANVLVGHQSTTQTSKITETLNDSQGQIIDSFVMQEDEQYKGIIFDGNLGLSQKVGLDVSNKKGTNVKLGVQLTQEFGPKDWNRVHGLKSDFFQAMKNMTFFLNRVELKGELNQKIDENKTLMAGAQYLGTNVGQNLLTQLGMKFQIPNDMEIYVLTGYGSEFGGYRTKQNYLPVNNNSGLSLKTGIVSPQGLNVGAGVRYDQNSNQPFSTQINATIPILKKKKKR
jgi:hypothetical protein